MEQLSNLHTRKSGWSEEEANMLWETAQDATGDGLALKAVFEKVAQETGRKPNSIRNYYYAQVHKRLGEGRSAARFVPFSEGEVSELLEAVLRDKAQGKSVRSCLQRISGGDHSLMLRYQNKYRSTIKARPELVKRAVAHLQSEGIMAQTPIVKTRTRLSLGDAMQNLSIRAQEQGDPELVRALETIGAYLFSGKGHTPQSKSGLFVKLDLYRLALDEQKRTQALLSESAAELVGPMKEFLALERAQQRETLDAFVEGIAGRIGALEERIHQEEEATGLR